MAAVGVYGTTNVFADDGGPERPFGGHGGRGFGQRSLDGAGLEAVANVLGMTTDQVAAALEGGQTLRDLAEQAGVEMEDIFEALNAVRAESMRERIALAVEDGSMSQEKADWLLEGLDKGFLDGPNFGFGRGGFDKPERPDADPEA
jgi:hypothetical protein